MRKLYYLLALSCLFSIHTTVCQAEEDLFGEEDTSFLAQQIADKELKEEQEKLPLSSFLSARLSDTAARNINKAEKIFCYTVSYRPENYDGYTIDDLAVLGSCGELSETGKQMVQNALLHNSTVFSTSQADCNVEPKIMLRYIYGPDHTDVLLSYPCPSLTFLHGQENVVSFNATPGAQLLDKIIKAYGSLEEKYVSPALVGQAVANGQILTQSQKEIVRRFSPTEAPLKKWSSDQPSEKAKTSDSQPIQPATNNKKGWGKLK